MYLRVALSLAIVLSPSVACAWNALGHKVVCAIAWQELDESARKQIVDTLKRHPRFAEDFLNRMPAIDPTDEWIFQQAGTWPDIARGIKGPERAKFNHPTWHYTNFPLVVGNTQPPNSFNLATSPKATKSDKWNVIQATAYCRQLLQTKATPGQKALAYCWLFHLVADMHQPLHSTALVCERFPEGDRGGNSIKLVQGNNLHALWDNLLGRSSKPNDVRRELARLRQRSELWGMDTTPNVSAWVDESRKLAKSFVYSPEILAAVEHYKPPVLPEAYLKEAGHRAQARIVAAGLRLAVLLGAEQHGGNVQEDRLDDFTPEIAPAPQRESASPELTAR